jgi:glyoxylase-like metal-dependent hydrolase (beta-lactamase superfamily II)
MNTRFLTIVAGGLALALISTASIGARAADPVKRAITKISGDLYRFQNKFHFSVFLVTDDGVIATDPINADAAKWLKAEIAKRFNKQVRYLVYSHDHRDHIAGGEVFADTAIVVAHENAKRTIIGEKRPTAVPDITFNDRMTLTLGGKTVELTYVGPSHSDNMIVMNFPAERTLHRVDIATVKRVPYRDLSDSYYPGWISALKLVEGLDFDVLSTSHGPMGVKADIADNRRYHEEMYAAVLAGIRAGQSLDQLKASVTMDAYKDWGQYKAWRPINVEGVYKRIQAQRRGN